MCFRRSHGGLRADWPYAMHRVLLTAEGPQDVADAVLAHKVTPTGRETSKD